MEYPSVTPQRESLYEVAVRVRKAQRRHAFTAIAATLCIVSGVALLIIVGRDLGMPGSFFTGFLLGYGTWNAIKHLQNRPDLDPTPRIIPPVVLDTQDD